MYRICIARSGSYYIQQRVGSIHDRGWIKIGPFFYTKGGARNYVASLQGYPGAPRVISTTRVVEYL